MDIEVLGGIIRIQSKEWPESSGQHFIDIRKWFEFDGVMKPSRKGFMVPVESWDSFKEAIVSYDI